MGFFDLFRPKWKHSLAGVRAEAVRIITDQNLLAEIAKTDLSPYVRVAAVRRLIDQALLTRIVKTIRKRKCA